MLKNNLKSFNYFLKKYNQNFLFSLNEKADNSIDIMKKTIMAVDDSFINLHLLRSMLKKDYDVLTALNGEEVFEILIMRHLM